MTKCNRILVLFALTAFGSFLSSCGGYLRTNLLVGDAISGAQSILVLPLDNLSPFPEAGIIIGDLVAGELRGYAGPQVRDKAWLESMSSKIKLSLPESQEPVAWLPLASMSGNDLMLTGLVYEYGYQREYQAVSEQALVAMRLNLTRVSDGRVLWTGSVVQGKGGDLMPSRPPLNSVAQKAVVLLLADLFRQAAIAESRMQ